MPEVQKLVSNEPEGTWSREDLAQLKADYTAHKAEVDGGTRHSNGAAAKDAAHLGDRIFEELVLCQKRTNCRGFAVIVGSHVNDTIAPSIVGTLESLKYFQEVQKIEPLVFAMNYNNWACLNLQRPETMPKDATERRSEVVVMIEKDLRLKTGNPLVKMNYRHYERVIQGDLGLELVGWPDNVKLQAPSVMGTGGAGAIVTLWQRLKSGDCRFEKIPAARQAEIRAKYSGKRRKGKGKEQEEAEEAETEPEPEQERKRKRKKPEGDTMEELDDEESEGEAAQKAKKAKEAKRAKKGEKGAAAGPVKKKKKVIAVVPKKKAFNKRRAANISPEYVDDSNPDSKQSSGDDGSSGSGGSDGEEDTDSPSIENPMGNTFFEMKAKQRRDQAAAAVAKAKMTASIKADRASGKIKPVAGPSKPKPKSLKEIQDDDEESYAGSE
ncbi:hypothetical protein GGX14DRAFT_577649 [Mycena pura]|uniref:Uncharacterized protein n=1 Tax=Mycena pura TaxID=153505 RepID=A0AAD6Y604_9AGAR|nr:hypothetical protein GGX14DRAFT_577649 [Mycena pura]